MNITIAGAGAGKTTNLASRIKNRYQATNDLRHIFCVAYTNNAVDNISRKLKEVFQGDIPHNIHVQTIHSFLFQEIIRPYYYLLFGNSFDHFSFSDKGKDARYYNKFFKDLEEKRILHVDATTQRANWVIVKKAGDNAEIRKRRKVVQTDFAKCCNSIFIDEAQDIDKETYEILKTLDKHGIWIDLVGDPKQDLRGYGYLRTLMDDFPDSVSYVNECYRCPDKILKISNSIIPSSEKQHSGIDGGEIKIIFESQQNNIACIVNSPIYDLRYIYKKNETYNTHDTANKTVIEGLTDIFEDILPNYFAGITSSELRIKRVAYYTACRFIEDNLNGASLSTSIHNTFGGRIKTSEYRKIAIALNACASYQNDKVIIRVDSIERIKGREGKHCLFILTPDLAAYLFGDKTDNNKIKNALYVALTRSLWKFTILVTKETEKKYERTRFKEHFTKLIHTPETYF